MRLDQLTFFRFVAAIFVVIHHFGRNTSPFDQGTLRLFIDVANSMVSFFFLLSGFVLTLSKREGEPIKKWEFYVNRFVRIYPLYLFSLLLFVFVRSIDGWLPPPDYSKQLLLHTTLTQGIFAENAMSLNYPAWSLSVEAIFYLLFPFLFQFLSRMSSVAIITVSFLLWTQTQTLHIMGLYRLLPLPPGYEMHFPLFHLSTFVMGVGAGILFKRHQDAFEKKAVWLGSATFVLATIFGTLIVNQSRLSTFHHSGAFNLLFLSTILFFSTKKAPFRRLLSSKPLVFLGEISYGIYILQYPAWLFFVWLMSNLGLASFYNLYTCTVGLILMSALTYMFIEKPALKLRSRLRAQTPLGWVTTGQLRAQTPSSLTDDSFSETPVLPIGRETATSEVPDNSR